MALSRDWMFCPISGALLVVDPHTGIASCADSNYSVDLTNLSSAKVVSSSDIEEYRRKYDLDTLVKEEEEDSTILATARATVDEKCPKCGHNGLEFYTMQLRSADEGQTVFYECPECRHKFSQNT